MFRPRAISTTLVLIILCVSGRTAWAQTSLRFHSDSGRPLKLNKMIFSPDGSQLAASIGNRVHLIDCVAGEILFDLRLAPFRLSFAPDGQKLLMMDRFTRILDIASHEVKEVPIRIPPGSLGFSLERRQGKLLIKSVIEGSAAADSGKINVGDELTAMLSKRSETRLIGKTVEKVYTALRGPAGTPVAIKIIPTGARQSDWVKLRRRADDPLRVKFTARSIPAVVNGNFAIFSPTDGRVVSVISTEDVLPRGRFCVSPDGRYFGIAANPRVKSRGSTSPYVVELYDVATQKRVMRERIKTYYYATFTPDSSKLLVASEDSIHVFDVEAKQHTSELALVTRPKPDPKPKSQSVANIGASAVQTAADEVGDTTILPRKNWTPILACINSDTVAVTGSNGRISLWSISSGQSVGHHDSGAFGAAIETMVASPGGQRIAYYSDGTLYIDTVELPDLN